MESTITDYERLPLGDSRPDFNVFGNAELRMVEDLCNVLHLSVVQKMEVVDVWKRHSLQRKGYIFFSVIIIFFTKTFFYKIILIKI